MNLDNPVRLIELFAGYGSQALALKYLGIPFEHHFVCEFDEAAIKSYNEIHGTNFLTSDVSQITAKDLNIVDTDKYKYLLTYSFPCTDLSLAGKKLGMARDSGTRSSLLWQVERLINECGDNLPQYLMMENVPQVIGKQNIGYFGEWTQFLVSKGYTNYYKVLNAENFNIPQHRERVIMISILKSENRKFKMPVGTKLTTTFESLMEHNVDKKYYLSNTTIERIAKWKSYQNPLDNIIKPKVDSSPTLTAAMGGKHCVPGPLVEEPTTVPTITSALGTHGNNAGMILVEESPTIVPTITARGAGEMHAGMQLVFDNNEIVDFGSSKKFWSDHKGETVTPTLKTSPYLAVVESSDLESSSIKSCWTPSETSLITSDGNVKHYNYDSTVESFGIGDVADLSYAGGYGRGGGRVFKDHSPTLTASGASRLATKESTIKGEWSESLIENNLVEPGDIAQITFGEPKIIKSNGVMQTITTRPDCFGVCVDDSDTLFVGMSEQEANEFIINNNANAKHQQDLIQSSSGICKTIPAGVHGSTPHVLKTMYPTNYGYAIRKLTPRECFRLMGVKDEDSDKLTASDSQKYKQAGNSIVVDVLMAVFENLFVKDYKVNKLF